MNSNTQAPFIRNYVDLPREMSDRLAVAAAERRTSKKRIMEELITEYLTKHEASKRGKGK